MYYCQHLLALQWRHNERDGVSNTSLNIVYPTVSSGADQRKHQSSASLAFVWGIHRWPVNVAHKGPVTRKTFLFDDVIMESPTWTARAVLHANGQHYSETLIHWLTHKPQTNKITVEIGDRNNIHHVLFLICLWACHHTLPTELCLNLLKNFPPVNIFSWFYTIVNPRLTYWTSRSYLITKHDDVIN